MFPAAGLEFPGARAFGDRDAFGGAPDCADTFDSDAIDFARQSWRIRGFYCEKQLEIFTAMKRELKRIQRAPST